MKKRMVNAADYAGDIMKALPKGILLTTKGDDKVNSMVIGWGTIGINWGKPVMAIYVRTGRYTHQTLGENPEFTINVPVGDYDKHIMAVCGGKSGKNIDKVEEAGLTLVEPEVISVPGIKELPLTLECKVIYQQDQELVLYPQEFMPYYPQDVDSDNVGANRDVHTMYFGEIVSAYIIEE